MNDFVPKRLDYEKFKPTMLLYYQ